jgi:hypothetical protein
MAELRDLIAQRLIGDGTHPWAERVVETAGMDPDQGLPPFGELPWIVVRQVGTTVDLNRIATLGFEVWIHGPNTSFSNLDELERLAIRLLDRAVLQDLDADVPARFALAYAGTLLGDVVIPAWDAYARGLRFTTSSAGLGGPQSPDDPRAAFLRAHAADLFCPPPPCVASDPTDWTPTDDCPGIYVRPFSGPYEVQRYSGMTQLREVLAIHVVAPTYAAQRAWTDRLALELPGQVAYVQPGVADSNGHVPRISTLLLRLTALNPAADAWSEGQLRVEATFTELACDAIETAGPLRQVTVVPRPPAAEGPPVIIPPLAVGTFTIGRRSKGDASV